MTTSAGGFVSSANIRMLFEYLKNRGIDASALLDAPEPDPVDHILSRYPMQRWISLLRSSAVYLDDPLLGLKLGQTGKTAHFGTLGYIFASCPNRRAALIRIQQYERLLNETAEHPMQTLVDGSDMVLKWSGYSPHDLGRLHHEFGLALLCKIFSEISEGPPLAKEICFVNSEPLDTRPFTDVFECDVLFNQPATTLRISTEDLNFPLRRPDPTLIYILEQQAERFVAQLPKQNEFVTNVQRCIANLVRSGEPTLEQVADTLDISPRTLRRRLHENDTTFRELLDDIRRDMAQQYLRDPHLPLVDVAHLLGYTEQSAFQRAFLRWTGATPKTFQRETRN